MTTMTREGSVVVAAPAPLEVAPADSSSTIAALTRDLSHTTSHNALCAAGVAFSVKQLADRFQSQLGTAGRTELIEPIARMHKLSQRANTSRELIETLSQRSDLAISDQQTQPSAGGAAADLHP